MTPSAGAAARLHRLLVGLLASGLVGVTRLAMAAPLTDVGPGRGGGTPSAAEAERDIEWLVATYGRLVYRVAYAVTRDAALAEDVVQDTMVKAWTSLPSWEGDQPVRWLRTVAKNRAISVMRKENRSSATDVWDDHVSTTPDTERVIEGRGLLEAMAAALDTLDPDARMMIVLRETDELSYQEIADLMGLTPSAVKAKLYRARHQLKQELRAWEP